VADSSKFDDDPIIRRLRHAYQNRDAITAAWLIEMERSCIAILEQNEYIQAENVRLADENKQMASIIDLAARIKALEDKLNAS
jgi:hypothetical protein